jgi:hypothetical protein
MTPTFILIGVVVGLLPRPWFLVGLVVAAVAWPIGRVVSGTVELDILNMVGEGAICGINLALGAVVGRLIFHSARAIRG